MSQRILSARASRTFYNVADALVPAGADGAPGAGDLDLVPRVERILRGRGPGSARRLRVVLVALEWWPLLSLGGWRGFSSAPLERRRDLLGRWRTSRLVARRKVIEGLEGLVAQAMKDCSSPPAKPPEAADQSEAGA